MSKADELIERLSDLYIMYRGKYVLAKPGGVMVTVQNKLNNNVMFGHVSCSYAVGVFAGPKATKFICFDVDEYDTGKVHKLVDTIESTGIDRDKIYVSSSGSKGFHVEVFFDSFVYNTVAENYYRLVLEQCGFDKHKVEFRPTRSQAIKIPLSVHPKSGNRCWYMDRETLECIVDEDYVFSIEKFSADAFCAIVYRLNKEKWYAGMGAADGVIKRRKASGRVYNADFDYMPRLKQLGSRHQLMLKIGAVKKLQGMTQDEIYEDLMRWYEMQDQSFIESSPEEVRADAISIAKWVCSDKFTPTKKFVPSGELKEIDRDIAVTVDDVSKVLAVETKSGRRILLLAIIYCRRMNAMILSLEQIGDIVGCTFMTVHRSVKMLEERKLLKHKSGGMKFVNGKKLLTANKYTVETDDNDEGYIVTGSVTSENFDDIYYGALASLCSDEELATILTKGEIEECRRRRLV